MFHDRRRELSYLDARYGRRGAELAVLYGRRRVGKSSLLFEWCREKPHLYYFAARLPPEASLAEFSRLIGRGCSDWNEAFGALAEVGERVIVVIDEYPYLCESVPGLSTLLQRAWDTRLEKSRVFLCLTGSAHSVVRREILDGDAPLYRRHTWAYELQPLTPADCPEFLPGWSSEQVLEAYAVLGGMPRNLAVLRPAAGLMRNIRDEILMPSGSLFNEVRLLLHEELKGQVDVYSRVLEALAAGNHQRREVAAACNLSLASVQHHLDELQTAGLVEHRLPLSRVREEARQGTWHVLDPFLRFWHRWVAPSRALLEIGQRHEETLAEIRRSLPYVVAPVWESVARQFLLRASGTGRLPFPVEEVGSWWTRGAQVDVVGVNRTQRRVVFGEARWRSTAVTAADLRALEQKALLWLKGDTSRWDVHYAFFGRRFGTGVVADEGVHLFTAEDVVGG